MDEVFLIVNPEVSGDPLIVVKNNIVDAITVAKGRVKYAICNIRI